MYCPRCSARTRVAETRGIFRDRHCTNPACDFQFTTRENIITLGEPRRLCARTRHLHVEDPRRASVARQWGSNSDSNPGVASSPAGGVAREGYREAKAAA